MTTPLDIAEIAERLKHKHAVQYEKAEKEQEADDDRED